MRLPPVRALVPLVLLLLAPGCGGEPPSLYGNPPSSGDDGGGGPTDCSTPCKCADRGPPNFSREVMGKPADSSDETQKAALLRGNHWRTAAGLSPLDANAKIEQAAMAHANFMATTDQSRCWPGAHDENNSCPGFTGQWPWDRMKAAGYMFSGASEVIDWAPDANGAIDQWIWTPYHRQPFMDYKLPETGFGYAQGGMRGTNNVMDFGLAQGATAKPPAAPAVFPPPGLDKVPPSFSGMESPQPPPPEGGSFPSGTVVSMHFPGSDWTVTEHKLYSTKGGGCAEVPHMYLSKDTDQNLMGADHVFMYANQPLDYTTEYVVSISGTVGGKSFTRVWAFTTQ